MTSAMRFVALLLGAGLVVAHVGEAVAFEDVTASPCSVVAGRDITQSTMNVYCRDPADVQEIAGLLADSKTLAAARQEAELRAEKLAGEAQTTKQQMLIFLSILAKQEVKPEQVPAMMAEITRNYQRQQDNYATLAPQDPGAADLVRQAEQATHDGRFDEADRLLELAVDRETAAVVEHQVKVAELVAARGDNAATQLHYTDAARYYDAAAAQLPSSASDGKLSYLIQAGDMWETAGNLAAALTSYQTSRSIAERLDPGNAGRQRDLAVSQERIGDVLVAQGNLPEALKSFRDGLAIAERLAKTDPGNAGWQFDLGISNERLGGVFMAQGNLAEGLKSYQAKQDIISRLANADPGNAGWQRDLSVSYARLADAYWKAGDKPTALNALQKGRAIMVRMTTVSPDNAAWRHDLAWFDGKISELGR